MAADLSNYGLVTIAVYLLGGDTKPVDTEDVAVKANEISPGRFVWRKYPNQINIEIVRAFLSDAKKPKYGALLSGTGTSGWMLTSAGYQFATENVSNVSAPNVDKPRLSPTDKRRRVNEKARVLGSDAFRKFESGCTSDLTKNDVDFVFRLNDYIDGLSRQRKVQRLVNMLDDDSELREAIRLFASIALGESE